MDLLKELVDYLSNAYAQGGILGLLGTILISIVMGAIFWFAAKANKEGMEK